MSTGYVFVKTGSMGFDKKSTVKDTKEAKKVAAKRRKNCTKIKRIG